MIAVVDLGRIKPFDSINVNFLQDQRSWIFYPTEVECWVSTDGRNYYKQLPKQTIDAGKRSDEAEIKTLTFYMRGYSSRFVKIIARNFGDLPEWHLGYPYNGKAWTFIDEITIK